MPYLGGITLAHVLRAIAGSAGGADSRSRPVRRRRDRNCPPARCRPPTPPYGALEAVYYADAVLWLAAQIADALAHAHRQGVLHLDLKPANVLFTEAGRPMLLDFHPADPGRTEPAGGTLPYMAPEQIEAFGGQSRTVDGRADLFALGVMLYQFFTGRLPFSASADSSAGGLAAALAERQQPPPDPILMNPGRAAFGRQARSQFVGARPR